MRTRLVDLYFEPAVASNFQRPGVAALLYRELLLRARLAAIVENKLLRARCLHASDPGLTNGGAMFRARRKVEPVAGSEHDVAVWRMKRDRSLDADQNLMEIVGVLPVAVPGFVRPGMGREALGGKDLGGHHCLLAGHR